MKLAIVTLSLLLTQAFIPEGDVTLIHKGEEIERFKRSDFELAPLGEPFLDPSKIQLLMKEVDEEITKHPVNAKIAKSGEIIPGSDGYKLYKKKFEEKFYRSLFSGGTEKVKVPKLPVAPRVDSELLANIRTKQIGHYITYFNSNNKERTHNIQLASDAIDGHVVFPGEVFSFNKVVGKRTKQKGYKNAPVIVRGEVTEGIGGGICQVSSTLFNSIDNAGITILERYSHSKRVPYVPPGRDATVSWYGPDFTFKNQYNQPLLIRSNVYGGQLSITIFSSDVINYDSKNIPDASDDLPEEKELEEN
ncbi:VanW family protein [Thalassobacillus hwangdonensis]|uniref:VanW family protein n=1 Tax=Thalassobacillus hwangdonensis TaxID=546108 RepID=A0ABW3L4T3_9BACI